MRQKAVKIDGLSFKLLRVHINLSYPVADVSFQRPNRGININDFSNERPNRIRNNQQSPSYKQENNVKNSYKNRHQPLNHHISDYYHNKGTVKLGFKDKGPKSLKNILICTRLSKNRV